MLHEKCAWGVEAMLLQPGGDLLHDKSIRHLLSETPHQEAYSLECPLIIQVDFLLGILA